MKGRKARWAEVLQEFDRNLRYRKGQYNVVADALSRMPEVENLSFTVLKSDLLETIKGKCEHDPFYTKVWTMVSKRDPSPPNIAHGAQANNANTTPLNSPNVGEEFHRWKNFSINDGHLIRKGRICVPKDHDIRCQIFYECHDSLSAGHPGIRKTYAHVRRHF